MTVHSKTAAALDAAKAAGRTGLVAFLPAGYPSVDECVEAVVAAAENGADVIELGLPYTDPVMDGPVIQAATQAALQAGFRVADVFDIIRRVTQRTDAAVLVMTYWNLVDRMGVDEFTRRREHGLRMRDDREARVGEARAGRPAVQQHQPQPAFEPADPHARCGLGDRVAARGGAETARLGDRHEEIQHVQFRRAVRQGHQVSL